MPQVFKVGPFWIYFWANEGKPMEPEGEWSCC